MAIIAIYSMGVVPHAVKWLVFRDARAVDVPAKLSRLMDLGVGGALTVLCELLDCGSACVCIAGVRPCLC